MNKSLVSLCCVVILSIPSVAIADKLKVAKNDTLVSSLKSQKGKRVSVTLTSGTELTGTVKAVNKRLVHLGKLSGREYFDAVVDVGDIEVMVVRVK